MPAELDRLLEMLDAEASVLESLLTLLKREQRAIAGLDRQEVERYSIQKQRLARELQCIEAHARREITRKLAAGPGSSIDAVTIAGLAERLPPVDADRLLQRREVLSGLTQELETANRINCRMYEDALRLLRTSLTELQPLVQNAPTYGAGGRVDRSSSGGWLVRGSI